MLFFAKYRVDCEESYHILFVDTLLSNFYQLGGILWQRYVIKNPCGVGWGRFCAQNRIKIESKSHRNRIKNRMCKRAFMLRLAPAEKIGGNCHLRIRNSHDKCSVIAKLDIWQGNHSLVTPSIFIFPNFSLPERSIAYMEPPKSYTRTIRQKAFEIYTRREKCARALSCAETLIMRTVFMVCVVL